ncbi:MAG: hypothetical protein WA269_10640 [Candidatus Udaeobacter sp.]
MSVAFYAAWLPRSFTLNGLVNMTAGSPPHIRACGEYQASSSAAFAEAMAPKEEADPPPVDRGVGGFS